MRKTYALAVFAMFSCIALVVCGCREKNEGYLNLLTPGDLKRATGEQRELVVNVDTSSVDGAEQLTIEFVPKDYEYHLLVLKVTPVRSLPQDYLKQKETPNNAEAQIEEIAELGWKAYRYNMMRRNTLLFWDRQKSLRIRLEAFDKKHAAYEVGVTYDFRKDEIVKGTGTFIEMDKLEDLARIVAERLGKLKTDTPSPE